MRALRMLNGFGCGLREELPLDLVYNPLDMTLPPSQERLEADYRRELLERFGIRFTRLHTLTNMPIGRFRAELRRRKREETYQSLLEGAFNRCTLPGLMCRHQISVDWDGTVHGCDFNLALRLPVNHGAPARVGLRVGRLPVLSDVDRPEDLCVWQASEDARDSAPVRISVIVPALNETGHLAATLAAVVVEPGVEVIVVDGGSGDATRGIAEVYGARVLDSPRGRARQMNAGAAAARGPILLFLHADTRLPCGFSAMLAEALAAKGVAGGAFLFRLDARSFALRLVEWVANIRSRWLGLPYGDQTIFLPADTFHSLGGYPECPIMEDVAFVRRLRRRGRVRLLNQAATTSARRWHRLGLGRTTGLHAAALVAYTCGLSPAQIHAWLTRRGYFGS